MSLIGIIIVVTGFLGLYWVFIGQKKYNDMFVPKRKTELKAVLFDLDGVIIDSFEAWFHVLNHVRRDYKMKELDREQFKKNTWGTSVEHDLKYFKNASKEELVEKYKKTMLKYIHKVKLMPDAEKVLKTIKKKKIKIGLVTNSFNDIVSKILKYHKIRNYFNSIVTADDVEKLKPYPDPVLKLCEKLNVMPDEAILVGDTKNDYKAGKGAGCLVVGLNTDGDLVIDKLSDMLELV